MTPLPADPTWADLVVGDEITRPVPLAPGVTVTWRIAGPSQPYEHDAALPGSVAIPIASCYNDGPYGVAEPVVVVPTARVRAAFARLLITITPSPARSQR
ncbi:hypothetical protein AB0K21_21550 [Streptosporangium sp. NPDC049248]|uniref:hypothetical protein n=1 Tax=Streptosporangium sp. NPDC049248 TaxID=3155651 RepID=UPI00342695F2